MTELSEHPEELLPFLVNETLDAEQRVRVEAHLAECRKCRDEVEFLRHLRSGMKASLQDDVPDDMAWPRLQRAIRRERNPQRTRRWLPAALAASLLVIVLQSIMLFGGQNVASRYTPAGDRQEGVVLQLRFDPRATEAEIRGLLQKIDATLIDGPGALGVYRARLGADADEASIVQRMAWLKQQTAVVRYVARD